MFIFPVTISLRHQPPAPAPPATSTSTSTAMEGTYVSDAGLRDLQKLLCQEPPSRRRRVSEDPGAVGIAERPASFLALPAPPTKRKLTATGRPVKKEHSPNVEFAVQKLPFVRRQQIPHHPEAQRPRVIEARADVTVGLHAEPSSGEHARKGGTISCAPLTVLRGAVGAGATGVDAASGYL